MTTTTSSTSSTSATSNSYGQSIMTSLSAGSGVDVKTLAQNLVNAEKAPQADAINTKITKCDAKISGYASLKFILSDLQSKFSALDDSSDFAGLSTSVSQAAAFSAVTSGSASAANHFVNVSQLAQGQLSVSSTGFASSSSTLSSDTTLNLTLGGTALSSAITLTAGTTTAQMVDRINSQWGGSGIRAQLVNKGGAAADPSAPYHLVISGPSGASNAFSLTGLSMSATPAQNAQDALLTVDGVAIQSPTNTVTDAIAGVTLKLTGTTSGVASLSMTRDISSIQTKIKDLMTSYNDVMSVLNDAANPDSKTDTYGATLVNDSTVSLIRSQVRSLFFGTNSSPGTSIKAMRDLGISVDNAGTMTLDQTKLTSALQNHFDDAVKMLSNNRSTPTTLKSVVSGTAGDAVKTLASMMGSAGVLVSQANNAQTQKSHYKDQLTQLNDRMDKLLARYNDQFTAMETLVNQINNQKTSLKSTFDAMNNKSN